MTHTDNYLTAGNLVTFTSGSYSDYSMHGTFVALETVTWYDVKAVADKLTAKARKVRDESGWYDGTLQEEFQVALIRNGWLLEVNNTERHLGSYSELELE